MQVAIQRLSVSAPGASARGLGQRSSRRQGQARQCVVVAAAGNGNGSSGVENVVVVGSGPAGYTAAIYAGRANLKPLVFEGVKKGGVPGGQLMGTTEVENFPGFPEGVQGPELMDRMRAQAERCGAELVTEDVESVDLSQRPFIVRTSEREVRTNSLILATGATARRLGLPRESEFWSRGISACAICDGAAPIFRQQDIAVIGGGDSATEEAVYLTKYAKHVHLVVRGEKMRASMAMQDRTKANPNITIHYNAIPIDVTSDSTGQLDGLRVRDAASGAERVIAVRGVFYGIGHTPNSDIVAGQVDLDPSGYVKVTHGAQTSVEGVFSAGDLHDTEWRQAITAAGSGCMAAISAERYLSANNLIVEFAKGAGADAARAHSGAESSTSGAAQAAKPAAAAAGDVKAAAAAVDVNATYHRGSVALRKLYHESQRPLVVVYTAPTCGPCRRLKPMLSAVVEEYSSAVHYIEIDIEEDPEIAEAAGVNGTPCVQIFNKKERLAVMNGVKMKSEYRTVLDSALSRQPAAA